MTCSECGRATKAFAIPKELREYVPENASAAAICPACLTLQPPMEGQPTSSDPDLTAISETFPRDPAAAIPMALVVGLLDSLALNRWKIEELMERVETEGVDPMLVLEDLAEDHSLNPAIDLAGRRRQLEQLLE